MTNNLSAPSEPFTLTTSRLFTSWLAAQNASIAFSTYQAGKLFIIGTNAEGSLSVFERTIERPMALHAEESEGRAALYLSSLYQLWRFSDAQAGGDYNGYDRLYVPRQSWVTGDIDIHDIKIDDQGRVIFVNTLFSCLATVSTDASFTPIWKPSFISKLAAEDRCHMNGLAMRDGKPAFVSAVAATDIADGWRDKRKDGGVIIDISTNEIVATGLSMPHAPRWRDGKLWLVNAGTGELGFIDPRDGGFTPVCFCPGFLRGLSFLNDYAIITMSLPRGNRTFEGLPLDERMKEANAEPRCGLAIIDLNTGDLVHWLRLEGIISELFDAVVIPGVKRPAAIGFRSDEVRRILTIGDAQSI